ncbi:hypothetical protein [Pseudomonas phage Astolliot]|nr:hypothetical protein [Pseudomonas phage Astolliot]
MRKVYVAGPWVFLPDAKQLAEDIRTHLYNLGFEALIPVDNESDDPVVIKVLNMSMIASADYVIADITPFRGVSLDPGTAFELGYATGHGKSLALHSGSRTEYKDRVVPDGQMVEDFGLTDNLMIAAGITEIHETFGKSAKYIKKLDSIRYALKGE